MKAIHIRSRRHADQSWLCDIAVHFFFYVVSITTSVQAFIGAIFYGY